MYEPYVFLLNSSSRSMAASTISLAWVYFMAFLSVLWVFEPVYMVLEDVYM
jgi:hypothetical protein